MNRKAIFVLAGVFLTIAIVAPVIILAIQADNDLDNLIIYQNPNGIQTNGNISIPTTEQIQESHTNNLIIVVVIELVFLPLFVGSIYYGLIKK
jgi:hypothetical protein